MPNYVFVVYKLPNKKVPPVGSLIKDMLIHDSRNVIRTFKKMFPNHHCGDSVVDVLRHTYIDAASRSAGSLKNTAGYRERDEFISLL